MKPITLKLFSIGFWLVILGGLPVAADETNIVTLPTADTNGPALKAAQSMLPALAPA